MGTRNLTCVVEGGEYKVAQYGQWDGYPAGQGRTIYRFLRDEGAIERLREGLKRVTLIDEDNPEHKAFIERYNANCPAFDKEEDLRTPEDIAWFQTFATRDLGAKILNSIADNDKDGVLLPNNLGFAQDSLFCEYAYVVDLDNMNLEFFKGFNHEPVEEDARFYGPSETSVSGSVYYPVTKIFEIKFEKLPETEEEFIAMLEAAEGKDDEE